MNKRERRGTGFLFVFIHTTQPKLTKGICKDSDEIRIVGGEKKKDVKNVGE